MKTGPSDAGMNERAKAAHMALAEPERRQVLQRFQTQMDAWQLTMPPHEPLVLDFGLGDFADTGLIEYWIANENAAGYCGKFLFVFDGQSCPVHQHTQKHETFFVVRGAVRMRFDNAEREMQAGDCLAVSPGKRHGFTGQGPALLLEISTPCEVQDNVFENPAISGREPSHHG